MKKICIISNLYKPNGRGGAERVAELQAEVLATRGHEVVLITSSAAKLTSIEKQNSITIYRFQPWNIFYFDELSKHGSFARTIWHIVDMLNIHGAWKVRQILIHEKPEAVITHNLKGLGFLIPRIIKSLRIKHLHVIHDVQLAIASGLMLYRQESNYLITGRLARTYQTLCRYLFANVDTVISPSQWLLDFYKNYSFWPQAKQIVLSNPIAQVDGLLPKPAKQNRYMFIGQMEHHKGIVWLMDYWQNHNINAELTVVGNGSLYASAVSSAPKNQKFTGRLRAEDLPAVFAKVDFLIMPSLCYENSPTVIPIAYANATPVLSTRIGGTTELVQDGVNGYLFEPGNEEQFTKLLTQINNLSDSEYSQLSLNALHTAESFDLNAYLDKLIDLA